MLDKASRAGLIRGLLEEFRQGGILTLQYVDDTLLFSSSDTDALKNLKIALMMFERVFGMIISFHKNEFIHMNLEPKRVHENAHRLSL
jgi:hypothetical protein